MPVDISVKASVAAPHSAMVAKAAPASAAEPVAARQELPGSGNVVPENAREAQPKEADVQKAVQNLTEYVQNLRRDLKFSVDKDSGRTIIKVTDSETGKLIRQIPPDEVLAIARQLAEYSGMLIKDQA
jgi:flagellar protein FlaG